MDASVAVFSCYGMVAGTVYPLQSTLLGLLA